VVVAYMFFDWLVPDRSKPEWVLHAKSKVVLSSTGDWLKDQLPENAEATILKKLKRPRPEETDSPDSPPDQHGELDKRTDGRTGYDRSILAGMQQLLEVKGTAH
jgi:membrane protein required for colicin V production